MRLEPPYWPLRPVAEYLREFLEHVPPGRVTTYGDLAHALGDPGVARAVATVLNEELDPGEHPLHRVVRADSGVGSYPMDEMEKVRRLEEEGVRVSQGRLEELDRLRVMDFPSDRPLKQLRITQEVLRESVDPGPLDDRPRRLVGLDVAYTARRSAVAAAVEVDAATGGTVRTHHVAVDVDFPYIPSYLAFRELPPIQRVLAGLDLEGRLLLVDGQGSLHPRGFGIACHVGVATGLPTIGVAKRLLCGTYDRSALRSRGYAAVLMEGERRGWAIAPQGRARGPVLASPGHKVAPEEVLPIVLETMGRRQPVALELAHALATEKRRELEARHSTMSS